MIDIPTLADVKKQENELIAQKEAEQLATQKLFNDKTQKALDNLINACLEKAKKGEIQYEYHHYAYDQLPECVDTDTLYTIARELKKAGFEVEYVTDSMMTCNYSYIIDLTIKW